MTTAVLDTGVKSLLARSGAMRILERIGVKEPLGRLWRLALNPRSVRENVDLFFDYRDWRRRGRSLAGNVPFSGPARRALVADLGVTPVGFMKAEAMLAKALQLRGVASTIVTQRSAAWKLRYFRAIGLDAFDYLADDRKREPPPAVSAPAVDLLGQAVTRAEVAALALRGCATPGGGPARDVRSRGSRLSSTLQRAGAGGCSRCLARRHLFRCPNWNIARARRAAGIRAPELGGRLAHADPHCHGR